MVQILLYGLQIDTLVHVTEYSEEGLHAEEADPHSQAIFKKIIAEVKAAFNRARCLDPQIPPIAIAPPSDARASSSARVPRATRPQSSAPAPPPRPIITYERRRSRKRQGADEAGTSQIQTQNDEPNPSQVQTQIDEPGPSQIATQIDEVERWQMQTEIEEIQTEIEEARPTQEAAQDVASVSQMPTEEETVGVPRPRKRVPRMLSCLL